MEFRILGPVEVVDAGVRLAIPGIRERTAVAVLVLRAGRVVSVPDLVDAIWPDDPPATARQQVRTAVSTVRRAIGDPLRILTRTPGYLLRVDPGEVDADLFEADVTLARSDLRAGRTGRAADRMRAALARWRGPALDGLTSPVVRAAAEALDERRLSTVEALAEAEPPSADLVAELTGLVAAHPLRERLRRALMLALHRAGRTSQALAVYRDGRHLLARELGVEPGEPLRAVERLIRREPAGGCGSPACCLHAAVS
jgi:DNA-binding SARP family transcriptional activator